MAVAINSSLSTTGNPDVYYNLKQKSVRYLSITDMELPYDFIGLTAVTFNNEIHVIGGNNATTDNTSYHIKWNGTQWVTASTLPVAFVDGRAVVCDGSIHLFNGTSHYAYNGSSWSSKTMPDDIDATGASVVVYQNQLHILGGTNNLTAHYKYNGTRWISASTLPRSFSKGNAVVYNNCIHIFGNSTSHNKWDGTNWELVSSSAPSYQDGDAVIFDECIYFLKTGTYIFDGTGWTSKSGVLFSPTYLAAVVYNDRVFYMGNSANTRRFCMELGDSIAASYSIS